MPKVLPDLEEYVQQVLEEIAMCMRDYWLRKADLPHHHYPEVVIRGINLRYNDLRKRFGLPSREPELKLPTHRGLMMTE